MDAAWFPRSVVSVEMNYKRIFRGFIKITVVVIDEFVSLRMVEDAPVCVVSLGVMATIGPFSKNVQNVLVLMYQNI